MNKKATATPKKVKPQRTAPVVNEAGWPSNPNAGIKNARSVHDRKPVIRGAVRGR